jgi:membrane complex biogenesis BtpA family protein
MPPAASPGPDSPPPSLPPPPWLIAVLHLPALPGAPGNSRSVAEIAAQAVEDARLIESAGFTAVLVENFHDVPYRKESADPETVAALAVVGTALRAGCRLPFGFNVLRNDPLAALAVAHATGGRFLRVNVLAGATVTDQGLIEGRADELLRRRAALGAQAIAILADVDVKHAFALDRRPVPLRARDLARRSGADALLVTGAATGLPPDPEELSAVASAVAPVPVLAASGTTPQNLQSLLKRCSGTIVGTALKDPVTGRLDRARCFAYTGRKTA